VRRDFDALERRRLAAIRLWDKGLGNSEVARRLAVTRQTVVRWAKQRREGGRKGLERADQIGRPPRLNATQRKQLVAKLLAGPEALGYQTPLWTCPRVADLIEREFGVSYHEAHVWKVLRLLGWSPQRPTGRARERNEQKIREWKRKTWPALKKKPARSGERSSSSTKAD
jgi:transposase